MSDNLQYLKPTIKAEPLIWQWYAWPYLIPPLSAGCNIVERHLKIMESYVQNPQIHCQAIKDPNLLGGPFIDLGGEKVDEVKELIHKTKKDCEQLITLNEAYKNLDRMLQAEAHGDTLEGYYEKISAPLKGLVELVYDLNNHPSIRLIEPWVYKKYYTTKHQNIALSETKSDFRKFILSTPYLSQDETVNLNIPFSDSRLDTLFKMKESPVDLDEILLTFDVPGSKQSLFRSFFTKTSPTISNDRNYEGEGVRIRYFGHACVLVQLGQVSILFDPVISYPLTEDGIPRYTIADLPEHIDYVVITHNHQDHIIFETLLPLRHKIGKVVFPSNQIGSLVDPSIKLILQNIGFSSLVEMKEMDSISLQDGEILALPFLGEHSDLNIQSKLSFCVRFKDKQFLFAADSNNIEPSLYEHLFDYIGPIDMLFLGMECDGAPLSWLYGPLLSQPLKRVHDKNRTLSGSNFEKAWKIAKNSKCKGAYIYAMGQEPWLNHIMALEYSPESLQMTESNKFIQTCRDHGIESELLFGKREWLIP